MRLGERAVHTGVERVQKGLDKLVREGTADEAVAIDRSGAVLASSGAVKAAGLPSPTEGDVSEPKETGPGGVARAGPTSSRPVVTPTWPVGPTATAPCSRACTAFSFGTARTCLVKHFANSQSGVSRPWTVTDESSSFSTTLNSGSWLETRIERDSV